MKKKTKIRPASTVADFANSNELMRPLPPGINALSFRLAVGRHNAGSTDTAATIALLRRTDEQTGIYYLARLSD